MTYTICRLLLDATFDVIDSRHSRGERERDVLKSNKGEAINEQEPENGGTPQAPQEGLAVDVHDDVTLSERLKRKHYRGGSQPGRQTMKRLLGLVAAALMALVAAGCMASTTLVRRDQGEGQVIYRISEEKAFTIALDAYAVLLPKQRVDDIVAGLRRGYNANQRFALIWYSHRVLVIPAVGTDASGSEVHGYWFDISGSGAMPIRGSIKSYEFLTRIQEALDATGTATVVTNLREDRYETDGRAYRAEGRDGRDVRTRPRSSGTGDADRLSELKSMRDKGLITREEYEAKRRQILDRM